jgi:hypothetical protein
MTNQVLTCTCGPFRFDHYGERDMRVVAGKSALIGQCRGTQGPVSASAPGNGTGRPISHGIFA